MQALFEGSRRKDITLKPIALAVALALLNGASLAASMSDVVSTRRAQSIGDQYGRDSLYASSPDDRRFETEQNPTNSTWFSRSVKADRPETLGKTASLALHDSAHSVYLLPGNRPQAYGRAGGYVGWERIAMMQFLQTTVASSATRGKTIVKNGADVADLLVGDDLDRRKSAARSGNDVNLGLSATNEAERRSAPGTRAIPQTNNKQPGSGSAAPSEPTPLRSNDQFAALVQAADDMSAMEPPSGGHDEQNSKAHREPNPFITEEHNSATAREESADMSAPDNGSGDQPDPVGRALPEHSPSHPADEGYLNAENNHLDFAPDEISHDTDVTDNASLDEADAATAIVVPLIAPSNGERDSPAVARLKEEPAQGASGAQYMPEVEVTVSVVGGESPMEPIQMSKRVK